MLYSGKPIRAVVPTGTLTPIAAFLFDQLRSIHARPIRRERPSAPIRTAGRGRSSARPFFFSVSCSYKPKRRRRSSQIYRIPRPRRGTGRVELDLAMGRPGKRNDVFRYCVRGSVCQPKPLHLPGFPPVSVDVIIHTSAKYHRNNSWCRRHLGPLSAVGFLLITATRPVAAENFASGPSLLIGSVFVQGSVRVNDRVH